MKTIREKLDALVEQGKIKEVRWFALNCAKSVKHLMHDPRSIKALEVTEKYLNGQATFEELEAAKKDTWAADWAAYDSHRVAFYAVASCVAADWAAADWAAYAAHANAVDAREKHHAEIDKLLEQP
jgi:hypothetical protein